MYKVSPSKRTTIFSFLFPRLGRVLFLIFVTPVILSLLSIKVSAEPTILEVRIAASTDDAEERSLGRMKLTSSDLELVYDSSDQTVGLRFNTVTVPQGASIEDAYIQFQADEINSEPTSLMIEGAAIDNASTFTDVNGDVSSRSRTASSVQWSPEPWTIRSEAGPAQRTPSIASIIQEVVDRPGWSSGNSVVIIVTGTGERVAEAFDGVPSAAPLLHIEFSGGDGNTIPTVSIMEPDNNSNFAVGDTVIFTSTADDAEDGDLSENVVWTSDLDGAIGAGALLSISNLSRGAHAITASVTDSGAITVTDQITVTIGEEVATLDVRVAASTDDAEELASGRIRLTSGDLDLVYDDSDQTIGLRFNAVTIPQGASIERAYVQLQTDETSSDTTLLTIEAENTDDAATFTLSNGNVSTRQRTTNTLSWFPPAWTTVGEAGPDQQTPDIAPIIQEIVDRPRWSSGNALAIIISGTGYRVAEAFDGKPDAAPLLHVEYSGGEDKPAGSPVITSFIPTSAQTAMVVEITGNNFSGAKNVSFNGISAQFRIASGDTIYATVPPGETSGPITVSDLTGSAISVTEFSLVPSPNVLVGAGDIGECDGIDNEATARLLDVTAGTVFTAGDNVHGNGTLQEFADCFDQTWGRHKHRTRPTSGNHEYQTVGAADYFSYFGPAAGEPGKGYYSYDIGEWHIIVLNSECHKIGGCDNDSAQGQWLQADLLQHTNTCTLAYWHQPRFSSGRIGNNPELSDFWQILFDAGAELVISGHSHGYERFAPQDANGAIDTLQGIRQFVVGTGGVNVVTIPESEIAPNSEVHEGDTHGVIKFTLNPGSYEWEFIPVEGKVFSDSGSASCH